MKFKKFMVLLLTLLLSMSILTGCGKSAPLGFNVKSGDQYKFSVTSGQKISMNVLNQNIDIEQTLDTGYIYDIIDVSKDGTSTVKVKYDYISINTSSQGESIKYDSRKDKGTDNPLALQYGGIIGQEFTMKVDKNGKVLSLEGIDKLIDSALSKLASIDPKLKASLTESIKELFGEEAMKEALNQQINIYPNKKVNVGDTWENEYALNYGMPFKIKDTWQLKEDKDKAAVVSLKSKFDTNDNSKPMNLAGLEMKFKLTGDGEGTLKLNKESGFIESGSLAQKLSGTAELTIPAGKNQKPQTLTVPVKLEGTETYISYKVKK